MFKSKWVFSQSFQVIHKRLFQVQVCIQTIDTDKSDRLCRVLTQLQSLIHTMEVKWTLDASNQMHAQVHTDGKTGIGCLGWLLVKRSCNKGRCTWLQSLLVSLYLSTLWVGFTLVID